MTRKNTVRTIKALLLAALLGVVASKNSMASDADDQKISGDLSVGIGAEHETGKYGTTQTTRSWTVPLDVSYDTDNYAFDLTVPFVRQTGPAGSIAGRIRLHPRQVQRVVTDSGVGDSTVSATRYLVQDDKAGVTWDIGVVVKLDTGDVKKGLGTGANDYSLQSELTKSLGKFVLTGTLGYSWLGSPGVVVINRVNENLQFKNVIYGSVDGSYPIGTTTTAGLTYFQEQAVEVGGFPQKDVTAYLNMDTSDSTQLRLYVLKGLADGSPDHGVGVTFTASF
ncbi:MAG: transporter family protein [Sulfuricaulis sp.]